MSFLKMTQLFRVASVNKRGRIALALLTIFASVALAWVGVSRLHTVAHANAPTIRETTLPSSMPWGVAFDNNNNVWVAEPGCDPAPVCNPQQLPGSIAQYNRQNFTLVANYTQPGGYSPPLFLAIDAQGNIWFTEPSTNAIGELAFNNGQPTWKQWIVPTDNATPYDLALDSVGNLWFTEFNANNIGEFIPSTQQFVETATPTANSAPYGIAGPDPTTGAMWFTENNSAVSQIGSFKPPQTGSLSTGAISEYPTKTRTNSTPHLLAIDKHGLVWWTEGFDGMIGSLAINQAVPGTSNGVTEYSVPSPQCAPGPDCGTHTSGIGVDSSGMVWFDDSLSSRIGSYDPHSGNFAIYVVGGSLTSNAHPHDGLAVDSHDDVWFTEEFANKLGEALPSGNTAPVSKSWYFAEGRVGNGVNEFLTLDNPDVAQTCAVNVQYLYTVDGGSPTSKTLTINIPPASRDSQSVNSNLNIAPNAQPAASVSTIVMVNTGQTPNCSGVVAERPMYFSNAIKGGSDVLGATQAGQNFYFADVPTGGGFTSYLTILNPGTQAAQVTATYYAQGQPVTSQVLQVAGGTRGTITPGSVHLPQHVAAVVTASQPIVVERPSYFAQVQEGNAGTVSGATCVVGQPNLSNDWLFAEGYTGAGFQEYLVMANLDGTAHAGANVTIKLEYQDGSTRSFSQSVPFDSTIIWSVPSGGSTAGVAAEVTSSGAQILVEREMYFQDQMHSTRATAVGGTDVIGQAGPAQATAYSFAEGYVGPGFDEWLTLQNPTSKAETLQLTLVNGYGRSYSEAVLVGAQTRVTLNIVALALQKLVHSGDGKPGYEIAMTVEAAGNAFFVAERPLYWNLMNSSLPTQGGSDVIGYTGT